MFLYIITFFSLYLYNHLTLAASCSWKAGGQELDLSALSKVGLYSFTSGTSHYNYSACQNLGKCPAVTTASCMVEQGKGTTEVCGAYLAVYDSAVSPTYSNSSGTPTWIFNYTNGLASAGCPGGGTRNLTIIFTCDKNYATYGPILVTETSSCRYTMTIQTNAACIGSSSSGSSSSGSSSDEGLSGGWIFIIILLVCLFLYCAIGYIYVGRKNDRGYGDVKNNIPNSSFWILLPKYVMAGCSVSKDYVVGLTNRNKNAEAPASTTTEN